MPSPIIGKMNLADIETADVLRVLKPIWARKLETADRVRGRIEKILHAAKAAKLRVGDNPAIWKNHLDHLLPSKKKAERHHPAMPYSDLPDFVRDLVKRNGIAPRALEMLILTVTRTGSLIGMRDSELDLRNAHTWTIPGERMKGGKEHVVPLCARALKIVRTIPREKGSPFLFMGQKPGMHISNMAMLELMRKIAPDYVPHGFRSSFTDWANEETDAKHEVIEMCLAHTIANKTEAAYRRGDLLEKRRVLLNEWEAYLYGRNPTETEIDEPETIKERDLHLEMVEYCDAKIKEMRELRNWAKSRLPAYPQRKRGPKEGSQRRTALYNARALCYAYDMIQRWRYQQRKAGIVLQAANPKPPGSWDDKESVRGKIIAKSLRDSEIRSEQTVANLFDRTNAGAPNHKKVAGVEIFIRRSDDWLSQRAELDV